MNMSVDEVRSAAGVPTTQAPAPGGMSAVDAQAVALVRTLFEKAARFPRNVNERLKAIREYGKIPEVAEDSEYSFRRGRGTVAGANIRIAEIVAAEWQNLHYGINELSRASNSSYCEAFCIDMQNGSYYAIKYVVPHRRDKSDDSGDPSTVELKSDRDIYEMIANMGARRLRESIFRVVPTFVTNALLAECRATKERVAKQTPLSERIPKAVAAWSALGVTQAMLAKWLQCPVDQMLEKQYQELLVIYRTINNHEGRVSDYFEKDGAPQAQTAGAAGKKAEVPADAPAAAGPDKGSKPAAAHSPKDAGAADAAGSAGAANQAGRGTGEPPINEGGPDPSGPPSFEDLKKDIEVAKTQDEIDEIQSLMSNNPNLDKKQTAELRSKLKAKISTLSME